MVMLVSEPLLEQQPDLSLLSGCTQMLSKLHLSSTGCSSWLASSITVYHTIWLMAKAQMILTLFLVLIIVCSMFLSLQALLTSS